MSLTIAVTAGKTLARNERANNAKLNALGLPTLALSGTASTAQIGDDQVTAAKAAFGAWFLCVDSGTASAHVLAASGHTISAYATGLLVRYKVNAGPNTGSTTANLASLGAKKIYKLGGVEVQAGDLRASQMVELVYDTALDSAAGGWWLISPIGNAPTWDRYATTGGTATAYTATFSPTVTALTNGLRVLVKWNATNTGTATFAPDGLTAKAIRKLNDAALVAGDILQHQISELVYDSTLDHWLITSMVAGSTSVSPVRMGSGLSVARASASTLTVAATELILKNSAGTPLLVSALSVTADLAAAGGGANVNCRESGVSEDPSTWYYLWAISDGTTAATLLNKSATTITNFPTGYGYKALLGLCYNNGSSNITDTAVYRGAEVQLVTYPEAATSAVQVLTHPHPFGTVPTALRVVAVKNSGSTGAATGYTNGQELDAHLFYNNTTHVSLAAYADATNLLIHQCAQWNGAATGVIHATTGAGVVVAYQDWDLKLYATFAA